MAACQAENHNIWWDRAGSDHKMWWGAMIPHDRAWMACGRLVHGQWSAWGQPSMGASLAMLGGQGADG